MRFLQVWPKGLKLELFIVFGEKFQHQNFSCNVTHLQNPVILEISCVVAELYGKRFTVMHGY